MTCFSREIPTFVTDKQRKHTMILIADSGSTKTDWCGLKGETCLRLQTGGINPVLQKSDDIVKQLYRELLPQLPIEPIEAIYFYGAGCTPLWSKTLRACLTKVFGEQTRSEVQSDMLGAARALCGKQAGIVCILGTGSNSCYYDGQQIALHTPALGYILGDEGSGAYLGRQLLNSVLKELLPAHICITFANETQLTQEEIIHKVYRRPLANRFLAGFTPFLKKYEDEPAIHRLLTDAFKEFITRNLHAYPADKPVFAVGSIAHYFQTEFTEALQSAGYQAAVIAQSPMEGLIRYHQPVSETKAP